MRYKNIFRFAALVTTIGLGAGLMLSGCGDSGSTTPNSLNGGGDTPQPPTPEPPIIETYKVTFQYNSLAKNLGRTEVASDIVSVKYAFYGKTDNKEFTIAPTKAHEFKHETSAQEQDITIDATEVEELNSDIYGVTAAYYAEGDKLVAIGYDTVDWQGQKAVTITSPNLYRIGQDNDELSLTSYDPTTGKNKTVFKPGENVGLKFKLLPKGESVNPYDLTPFATFSNLNDITDDKVTVLTAAQNSSNGQFVATDNGTAAPQATTQAAIGDLTYMVEAPIYVTEQTIESITLSPDNSSNVGVIGNKFYMIYVEKKDADGNDIPNATLGQKTFVAEPEVSGFDTLVMGVDEVPMQVIATYTNEANKGPQPQDVNIIDQVELKANLVGSESDSLLKAQDGVLVATGTTAKNTCDTYQVTATYDDKHDTKEVTVSYATSKLCFAWTQDNQVKYVPENYPIGRTQLHEVLEVVGRFYITDWTHSAVYNSHPFHIDGLVGKNSYPEALVENEPFTDGQSSFKQKSDGVNSYDLDCTSDGKEHTLKVATFPVALPEFEPFILKP